MHCIKTKTVVGCPNYAITKNGKVWSKKHKKFLRPALSTHGYPSVCLYRNGKYRLCKIHQLVLEAFVGSRPEGFECRHLNGIKTDNRLKNLKWGTHKENVADMKKHGVVWGALKGEQNYAAKLTKEKVVFIRKLYATGRYHQATLAKQFNVTPQNIYCIIHNKSWKHVLGGIHV